MLDEVFTVELGQLAGIEAHLDRRILDIPQHHPAVERQLLLAGIEHLEDDDLAAALAQLGDSRQHLLLVIEQVGDEYRQGAWIDALGELAENLREVRPAFGPRLLHGSVDTREVFG